MDILIQTIPHHEQRYPTVGDWWFDEKGNLQIRVSRLGYDTYECLIAVHELWEALECLARGITEAQVTEWDKAFVGEGEPGDDPDSPYYTEHRNATFAERLLCIELGLKWDDYEKELDKVYATP